MTILLRLVIGFILAALIGIVAYRRGSLARSGVVGAVIVGTAIFGFGGWSWGLLLITFFVTSSLLSHYQENVKASLAEKFSKGSRRDLWQALANGGAGALIAAATLVVPRTEGYLMLAAFVGAMATVNADTWATELGVLNPRPPRLITTGKRVEIGTSGGVTLLGTLASLAGAALIGIAAVIFLFAEASITGQAMPVDAIFLPLPATLGGLGGSLFDSLLGATLQAMYYSEGRQKETEKRIDPDGTPNRHLRGLAWLDNDMVNFISSGVGAGIAALALRLMSG